MATNIYTEADWIRDGTFKAVPGQEVEEGIYWESYECLPPLPLPKAKRAEGFKGFMVSEPYAHRNGRAVYAAFGRKEGRFFFLGHLPADVDKADYTWC